jgi:hypothetical protein
MINNQQASENILAYLNEGRLVKRYWKIEREGRYYACLLGAAFGIPSVADCPNEAMPKWMAECTVTLVDGISNEDLNNGLIRRYADLLSKWTVLSKEQWANVLARWLVRLIDQAIDSIPKPVRDEGLILVKVCEQCKSAVICKNESDYAKVTAAVKAAASAHEAVCRLNAHSAVHVANAAAYAAHAIVDPTSYAAYAAHYAAKVASNVANDEYSAYKSLFQALLDEIEKEIFGVQS